MTASIERPALTIQTVYFHESDRPEARRLGSDLYERLTRPIADPLAHGLGIPVLVGVKAELVDLEVADAVVVIPVLGGVTRGLMNKEVLDTLNHWHSKLGPRRVLPVPTALNWRSDEPRLLGKFMLSMLYGQ